MNLQELLQLPWTWVGPRETKDEGGAYWVMEVLELPDFVVAAKSKKKVEDEAFVALKEFLQSYLDHGETPPLPSPGRETWVYMIPTRAQTLPESPWRHLLGETLVHNS